MSAGFRYRDVCENGGDFTLSNRSREAEEHIAKVVWVLRLATEPLVEVELADDFLIVVLGVFLGIQAQEWSAERGERRLERVLERLLADSQI